MAFYDPSIAINWQLEIGQLKLSEKDTKQPLLKEVDSFKYNINLYE